MLSYIVMEVNATIDLEQKYDLTSELTGKEAMQF